MPQWEASAPGRVNLIGEHVDYCDGVVLPMAIDRRVTLLAKAVFSSRITLVSDGMPDAHIDLGGGLVSPGEPKWSNYVRGVIAGFQRRGAAIPGMDIEVRSSVPIGGGLSSSAALEVATATLLEAVTGQTLEPRDKALLCQHAEHDYAGVPCGIMDQFASVFGRAGHALLIDCRSQDVELIPMPADESRVMIVDTCVKHELAGNEYAKRRGECADAVHQLGVRSFRELAGTDWHERIMSLPDTLGRRARHVLSEMERVPAFVACLRRGAWADAGAMLYESHTSLRLDYEVSCSQLDFVVDSASRLSGIFGCRMTGGGFGGCCVALAAPDRVTSIQESLKIAYRDRFGVEPVIYVTCASDGPSVRSF